jgi:putative ABC transport system permease protein
VKTLLRYFSWRHLRRRPLRALLGVVTVALGVALFVAVEATYTSSFRAFEESIEALAGRARLQITRADRPGIEQEALARIERVGNLDAAPVFHFTTTLPDLPAAPILVLGVDFGREPKLRRYTLAGKLTVNPFDVLIDPSAVLVPQRLAARHGWAMGSEFRVNTPDGYKTLRVVGLLEDHGAARVFGGNIMVMSIGYAQRLFGRRGQFDRINVAPVGIETGALAARLREALGPDYKVTSISRRNSVLEEVLARVRTLSAISMIGLMVGLFLIYNSMSVSVVERAREIGILRSLGASRGAILGIFLVEALVAGLWGSVMGVGLGQALADQLTDFASRQVNALMFMVVVEDVAIAPSTLAIALALGTVTAVVAAAVPAWQAARISPLEAMRPSAAPFRLGLHARLSFMIGAVLCAICAAICGWGGAAMPEWALLGANAVGLLGVAMVLPLTTLGISRLARRPLGRLLRISGFMAANNILLAPQRTSLTVVALGGALGMMVATAAGVKGFERSALAYLDRVIPFDLFVAATDMTTTLYSSATYPRAVGERLKEVEGVAQAYSVRAALQAYGSTDLMLICLSLDEFSAMHHARGSFDQEAGPEVRRRVGAGEAVVISENLSRLHGLGKDDTLTLVTAEGPRSFAIIEVFEDYSWPQGTVFMDLDTYARLWRDDGVTYTNMRLAPGFSADQVKANIAREVEGQFKLFAYSAVELRALSEEALSQSFRFADMLIVIGVVIGFLGIANTLLISVLRRTREIGLLRAAGMTRGQVAGGVVIEALLMAAVGGLIGAGGGLAAAWYPLSALSLKMTGFEMARVVPGAAVAGAMAAALLIGLVAAALPARRAAGVDVLEAIAYE